MLVEFQQQVSVDCNDWRDLITALNTPDKDGHKWTGAFINLSAEEDDLEQSVKDLCEFIANQAVYEATHWSSEENCFVKFIEGFGRFYTLSSSARTDELFLCQAGSCTLVLQVGRFENAFDPEEDRKNEI